MVAVVVVMMMTVMMMMMMMMMTVMMKVESLGHRISQGIGVRGCRVCEGRKEERGVKGGKRSGEGGRTAEHLPT